MEKNDSTHTTRTNLRCPLCGNVDSIPLEKINIKNEMYPDASSLTVSYCVGCGNIYGATMEKVVRF